MPNFDDVVTKFFDDATVNEAVLKCECYIFNTLNTLPTELADKAFHELASTLSDISLLAKMIEAEAEINGGN